MRLFQNSDFLSAIPRSPGVYFFHDEKDEVIYVGKAKNLRTRLSQYRNVKSGRKFRKMKKILKAATRISWQVCESEVAASLKEINFIQSLRPMFNVSGAYCFLYPYIGLTISGSEITLCYTTHLAALAGVDYYGAYRRRERTSEAFFAAIELLQFIGHLGKPLRSQKAERPAHTYVFYFRQIPCKLSSQIPSFLKGEHRNFVDSLVLLLLEKPAARGRAQEIQEKIEALAAFYEEEAVPLAKALKLTQFGGYPVKQEERDPLFISYRAACNLQE